MGPVHAYLRLAGVWCRALLQYPVSLAMLTLAQTVGAALDVAAILIVFAHTTRIAGFTEPEVLFLYGTAATAFALADTLVGSLERIGAHIRSGWLDVMLTRPVSPLVQVAVDRFSPRRLGKLAPALAALLIGAAGLDVAWTPGLVAFTVLFVVSGTVIASSIWVVGAAFQFIAVDAAQASNAFTYGGKELTSYPMAIYPRDLVRFTTFVVPLAFVNWQPALYVLDRPDPLGLPEWLRHASPAVALATAAVAALCWRAGLRRYRSTGS
ncbi:MAG: transporter [Streptosporangiales bacterium]|nr:transporter [Streptosporangiales bacterium]